VEVVAMVVAHLVVVGVATLGSVSSHTVLEAVSRLNPLALEAPEDLKLTVSVVAHPVEVTKDSDSSHTALEVDSRPNQSALEAHKDLRLTASAVVHPVEVTKDSDSSHTVLEADSRPNPSALDHPGEPRLTPQVVVLLLLPEEEEAATMDSDTVTPEVTMDTDPDGNQKHESSHFLSSTLGSSHHQSHSASLFPLNCSSHRIQSLLFCSY
jgi:hypothetical protein